MSSRIRNTALGLCMLMLFSASAAFAQNYADPYLRMGVGARAMAMGTAQTAVANDATAAYWNPAAMHWLHKFEVSLMYTGGLEADRNHNYIGASLCAERIGTFGLSWLNSGITGIGQYDPSGNKTGSFDVSNNAFQLSYARGLGSGFSLGLSAKYLQEDLADNTGWGVDAGLLFIPYDEIMIGFMMRDAAGEHGKDDLPYEARLGLGVKPWKGVTLTSDLQGIEGEQATLDVGGAYDFEVSDKVSFYLAAGVNDLVETDQASRGMTAGFGFGFKNFGIQYAYVEEPQEFLNENHRLSVNFYFRECNTLKSAMGSLKRERHEEAMIAKADGPKEFIHRYIFEGNPSLKLSLELLRPEVKDSIESVWMETGGVVSFPGINFATGSAEITDEFARVLDGAAKLINEHPEIQLLEVQGHTDNTGSDAINNPLSQARADAVRNYLISRGVDPSRLVAKGYGSTKPVASNASEQGRYQNRRIDLVRVR
ncbi:MAG: OmpA family protein [Calditrichaeota bacterium]|nr:OmpA family protein [Calditrichota bacterium]MCB9391573.1 OmpA family protein [Calditrichota bacterium]